MLKPRPRSALRGFIKSEAAGGVVLMAAAAVALVIANSPAADAYFHILHLDAGGLSVAHWINDGLMAIFFLLVGLEIKREMLDGQLSTWPRRALPGLGAVGGMAVPALIYVALNAQSPETIRGWAIPAATDIAFALGVLSLLGKRAPVSLKVFLTALAILDDLGAVLIIAVFYTADLSLGALAGAGVATAVLIGLNRFKVRSLWAYLAVGAVLWVLMLNSGVHATIAGVITALCVPITATPARSEAIDSPLHRLEHFLQPWVAFIILPIFGFANAGVSFAGLGLEVLLTPIALGVALGLFLGKQVGVLALSWLSIRLRWAELPANATWLQFYGVSLLCGVGFTMSLFIGLLAFDAHPHQIDTVKIGVLAGSLASALAGALVLLLAPSHRAPERPVEVD